ncbi:hypothetical protein WMO24_07155 [Ruthenibacterium sp. CLA-JM-H11]|uniref:Uncharacterized protein n=1 Tax=Ruthenibacterium intestinale TaxID=3133163 RepID=A0ABV1GEG4_9FIRM
MLIFWSLVRNSVVLAVYLLFSVACFLTVHEHSDLRFSVPEPLLGCISILRPEDFPLTQWYDLYEYLTGTRKFFSTQEQARAELIRFIQEK